MKAIRPVTFQHALGQFTPQNVAVRNPFPLSGKNCQGPGSQLADFVDYTYSSCKHEKIWKDCKTLPKPVVSSFGEISKWIILLWLGNPDSCETMRNLWKPHWSTEWPMMTHPITRVVKISCRKLWRLKDLKLVGSDMDTLHNLAEECAEKIST